MSPLLSTDVIERLGAGAFQQRDTVTNRCLPGCNPLGRFCASVSSLQAPTAQGFCAICRTPASKFWRSRYQTNMIAADAVKATILMLRTLHTQPSPASAPSLPKAVTG